MLRSISLGGGRLGVPGMVALIRGAILGAALGLAIATGASAQQLGPAVPTGGLPGGIVQPQGGGTGVANTDTLTLGGALTTIGSGTLTPAFNQAMSVATAIIGFQTMGGM